MSIPVFIPLSIAALGLVLAIWLSFRGERPYEPLLGVMLAEAGGMLWALTAFEGPARAGVAVFFAIATVWTSLSISRMARAWAPKQNGTGT